MEMVHIYTRNYTGEPKQVSSARQHNLTTNDLAQENIELNKRLGEVQKDA